MNGLIGSGVKKAVSQGLSVPIDQKISDKGITIHFSEVYVEDSKVLIHYRIEKHDGTLSFIGTEAQSNLPFTLIDAKGEEINTGIAGHDKPEGVIAFVTSGRKLPKTIKLLVNVNRIGTVKGIWKGQFIID